MTAARVLMMVPDCQMIDRRVLQQARSLVAAGCRVDLLAGFECPGEQTCELDGIRVHRCAYDWDDPRIRRLRARLPGRLRPAFTRAFRGFASRCLRFSSFDTFVLDRARAFDADVVHVHDLPLLKVGVRLAAERGVPLVFDAHEIYHEQDILSAAQRRRLAREERRGLGAVDLFITVNDAIAEHYEGLYAKRPMVLLNCADRPPAGFDADSRRALREAAGVGPETRIVLYQGWISPERNIETLVRAAEHLPDAAALVLIGYGEYEAHLRHTIEGRPGASRVRFVGRVEPDRILAMTAGADVGVIPYLPIDLNHRLCSPNKFFEYVQAGVPVVAHDLPFFRTMAERFGVVHTGDLSTPDRAAAAVGALLDDPARLEAMRQACRAAAETLNWQTESAKLLAAYRRLLPGAFHAGRDS